MKKRILILLVLLVSVYACAQGAPEDGLYTIGVYSNAKMMRVTGGVLSVEDGQMTATVTLGGTGYGYLYPGTVQEAALAPRETWSPFEEDWEGNYTYAFPIDALDEEIDVAGYSRRYEKWYDRKLTFHSNTLTPYQEVAPLGVYSGVIESDTALDGQSCVITSDGSTMTLDAGDALKDLALSSLDVRVPLEGGGYIKVESRGLESYAVRAEDGVYRAQVTTDSGLLRFTDCELTAQGGRMTALLTAKNNNFDYLYLGSAKDAAQDEMGWIPAKANSEGKNTYTLDIASLDNEIPVATYSGKKKMWYDRTMRVESASLERVQEPIAFSFTGGTGRVNITCEGIVQRDGQSFAKIVFDSPNYLYVKTGGVQYDTERSDSQSVAEIPVRLNGRTEILAMTTTMSVGHEIAYSLYIGTQEGIKKDSLAGLAHESSMLLAYAAEFAVDTYEGGYALIDVKNSAKYLVVPEGKNAPEGLDPAIVILQQPLDSIYLAATSAMALFDALDSLDAIRMSGTRQESWYIENAAAAMARGDMRFAGKYSEPDFEMLLLGHCDLAIESMMISHQPKVKEMLELLGIPVFIDCSSNESHPLGRTEWIKLYGVLMDKEEEAEAFFAKQAEIITQLRDFENTGKTVAFFYLHTDGTVVVRAPQDYVPGMIEIAGGRYAFDHLPASEGARSSVSVSMEEFYAAAVDADYLIYNATIDDPVASIDELLAKSPLFADFKAVKEGNVFCTGKYLYQATDTVGGLIADIHQMLTGKDGDMQFMTKLK